MFPVSIGAKPPLKENPLVPLAMTYNTPAPEDRYPELGDDVRHQFRRRKSLADAQANGDSGV